MGFALHICVAHVLVLVLFFYLADTATLDASVAVLIDFQESLE